jgi:hypothetical protein
VRVLWPTAPTAAHRERDAARKEMVAIFGKVIAARRKAGVTEEDFLQKMIDFRYKVQLCPSPERRSSKPLSPEEDDFLIPAIFLNPRISP